MAKPLLKAKNGPLVAVVASVAVAAVVIGSAIAYWQGPESKASGATPLPGLSSTPSETPIVTPSRTPSITPSTPPSTAGTPGTPGTPAKPPSTGNPVEIPVELTSLATGRSTDAIHLAGREVRGGGPAIKIPGSQRIGDFARLGADLLATVGTDGVNDELLIIGAGHPIRKVPNVDTLVADRQGTAAAYSTLVVNSDGIRTRGGAVHYLPAGGTTKTLPLPADTFALRVVALLDGKVYYRSTDEQAGDIERLYEWTPGTATPRLVKAVTATTMLSADGRYAASRRNTTTGTCTTVQTVATGKDLWKACKTDLMDFTPGGGVTLGRGYVGDTPMVRITAQDTRTGKLIHAWTGFFANVAAEDDEHLLISTEGVTGASLVRCEITTGACEYAVAPGDAALRLDPGMTP
ncbi:hypothetical protein OHA70_15155 [Kribbella sp. NBC_00382]|uniref:hypothetical protein n=1 Tax=Kribbella sp. NBC_00382 TaxID=2975967 RepID=UPI002E1C018C